jgi:DNA-binding NarL/FixJ family response regulator
LILVRLKIRSPALRAGLAALISDEDDMEVVDEGYSSTSESPTVLITTSTTEDGNVDWDSLAPPEWCVLLLRDQPVDLQLLQASSRARGVLPFDASPEELRAAIRALAAGLVVGDGPLLLSGVERPADVGPLTEREVQVLGLVASGLANKQIALVLGISEHTVKFHVSSIYGKLNAANRTQAVREGLRRGWIVI